MVTRLIYGIFNRVFKNNIGTARYYPLGVLAPNFVQLQDNSVQLIKYLVMLPVGLSVVTRGYALSINCMLIHVSAEEYWFTEAPRTCTHGLLLKVSKA